jgi:23S rRNA (guanosine2251-2'-O)-methyltransferase
MSKDTDIVAGIQPVIAALKANPQFIRCLLIARGSQNRRVADIEMLAADLGVEIRYEAREALDQVADVERHQDVVAELVRDNLLGEADLEGLLDKVQGDPLVLVLDGVQDPHNLGACLRTAEAAGVHAVIIPKDRAVGLTPVVRKASAGASEVVPLVQVTNLARVLKALQARGIWLYGATDTADQSLYGVDMTGPVCLVMGSEGQGMRRLTAQVCDHLVSIPMAGVIESLNVSVATGVCLYEIQRQRSAG